MPSPSPAGALLAHLFILMAAVLPAAWSQAAASQLVIVKDVGGLTDAFRDASRHIELQEHLDLRAQQPPREAADLRFPWLFRSFTGFQSLRVRQRPSRCVGASSSSLMCHRVPEGVCSRMHECTYVTVTGPG